MINQLQPESVCWFHLEFFPFLTMGYGILVPQPGIKPMPLEVEAWSLNLWTTRKVTGLEIFSSNLVF